MQETRPLYKYLKSRQEYIDQYDQLTVEDCRWKENFHKNYKPTDDIAKKAPDIVEGLNKMSLHYDLLYATLQWWEKKESTIQEWMDRDEEKNRLLEDAKAPAGIRCLKCRSLTIPNSGHLYTWGSDGKDRVLFMYDCPNGCLPCRAFFHDGEEYRIKPDLCSKCQIEFEKTSEKIENKKIVTTSTCTKCGFTKTDELDLTPKEEKLDLDFAKDRERFCLSEEIGQKRRQERLQIEEMGKLVDKFKEKEERKDEYEAVEKLKKLTVVDLEKLLIQLCEKAGYIKFQFGNPDMGKDIFIPFTVHDSNSGRQDRASTYDLQKIIKKALEDTNWRLMSDGVSYRLGILTGRLHAYEREEDLLKLVTINKE